VSKDYAARRRPLIDPRRAVADARHGAPVAGSDTVYFCAVDGHGNACSFINSNYMVFGTGIVPHGWGFALQNRGHNFSLDPGHPNALAPNKRPYHTIIPGMMTRADGSLYAPFGVMGGFMQPQGHVQVVVAMLDDDAEPQAALDRPRLCVEPRPGSLSGTLSGTPAGALPGAVPRTVVVALEDGVPAATAQELRARGHRVISDVTGLNRSLFGRGQIIRRDPDGRLVGGSDLRGDGYAAGVP
jgi:gamma-glutamyltranspeptidase/glutathione hydrolase